MRKSFPFATGIKHSIFIDSAGDVYTCGSNASGELGLGDTRRRTTPVKINTLPPIKAVSAGNNFSLFLDFEGNVWGAGKSDFGQLGRILQSDGIISTPEKLALPIAIQVVAASHNYFSMFLDINGNVWACGYAGYGQLGLKDYEADKSKQLPTLIPCLPAITDVSAGYYHTLFLDTEMNVWATGYNAYGQLGLEKADKHIYSPEKLNLSVAIKQAAAGSYHSLFLDTNGQVWACGHNTYGQLAVKHLSHVNKPELCQGLPPIQSICGGYNFSTFVDVDGRVWKCGAKINSRNIPELQDGLEGIQCAQCVSHNIYLDAEGQAWVAGRNCEGQLGLGDSLVTLDDSQVSVQKLECLQGLAWEQMRFQKTKSARKS